MDPLATEGAAWSELVRERFEALPPGTFLALVMAVLFGYGLYKILKAKYSKGGD